MLRCGKSHYRAVVRVLLCQVRDLPADFLTCSFVILCGMGGGDEGRGGG